MLVVFRVVATEKSPKAVAEVTVDVTVLVQGAIVAQDDDGRLHIVLVEGRGLAHKALHQLFVTLCEHRRDRIPLGREIEKEEVIVLLVHQTRASLRDIDVGDFVFLWINRN